MNLASPLVSIITSCYNHEKFLDDYFQGLLNQTYNNIELIFFDDGSVDKSWEKAIKYEARLKKKFLKVVLERHSNKGFFKELAEASNLSAGKYIGILESDDYFLPQKIEKNVQFLEAHADFGMVHSDFNYIDNKQIIKNFWKKNKKKIPQGNVFEELLTQSCFIRTCSALYRADLFKKYVDLLDFERQGYLTGDTAIWLSMAKQTQFAYIDEALACYRIVPGSLSRPGSIKTLYKFWLNANQIMEDFISKYGISRETKSKIEKRYHESQLFFGRKLFLRKELLEACDWLIKNYPDEYKKISIQLIKSGADNLFILSVANLLIDLKTFIFSSIRERPL